MSGPRSRRARLIADAPATDPARPRPARRATRPSRGWGAWLADPRTAVLSFLALAVILGGGRKFLQGARSRRAIAALEGPDPTPEEVEAAAEHGRAGIMDLFRLLGTSDRPEVRDAAGRGLARLWLADELIAEEEKALVRRGFVVTWHARRRYPRGMRIPIPIRADHGVPFLVEDGPGITPASLEWSHKVLGAEQARLEEFSPWRAGPGSATFEVEPGDFPTDGPHRLVLACRVRVVGLTETWELELPHIPFSFEFDPNLAVGSLLTMPDDARGERLARAIRLEAPTSRPDAPRFLDLDDRLVMRDPPELVVEPPLPCDLAHLLALEFEGIPGRFRAGSVVVSGQGTTSVGSPPPLRFPIGPVADLSPGAIDRPGERRVRAILTADPELGWADPDIRSVWPGELTTDWVPVRVIRR